MRTRSTLLAAFTVFAGAGVTSAYVLNGPKWGTQQVPYYINPVNADMAEADAVAAIEAGAMAWAGQSTANILPYYIGRTSGSSIVRNGKNEVFFRDASAGGMAAEVYWWYDGSYQLVEADMMFYDGGFTFLPSTAGCAGGLYLQDIATHEWGHSLGLGHSTVGSATMYPSVSYCSSSLRSLDPDDLAAIEHLYPGGATNTPPSVTISSPAAGAIVSEGTSVTFSGGASDKEDGNIGSWLVWVSSLDGQIGSGPSFIGVLSIGSHTITAKVTDSKGATSEAQRTMTVQTGGTVSPTVGILLSARPFKVRGLHKVELTWSGATSTAVDVYRDGIRVTTTQNSGSYTDPINRKGGASYTYFLCETGTSSCSDEVRVTF